MVAQLDAAGAKMTDVIKLTGFIVDMDIEGEPHTAGKSALFPAENPPQLTLVEYLVWWFHIAG